MMFKNIFNLIIMCMLLVLFGCSGKYGIRFDQQVHDFGVMEEQTDVKYSFEFTNTGRETLVIENVQPSCGCTTAYDWDKIVAPGGKGKIPITFKAPSYNGEVSKLINVKTNIPEIPGKTDRASPKKTVVLTLKGKIMIPVEIVPLNAWLGEISKTTNELEGSFDIKNNTNGPLVISEVVPPDSKVQYRLTVVEKDKRYKLEYSMNAPFEGLETVSKQFSLKTNIAGHELVYPRFYYFVPPPLRVYPQKISVDATRLNRANIFEINVKSTMDVPVKILGLSLHGGKGITYSLKENEKDKFYQIVIKLPVDYVFLKDEKIYFSFSVQNDPAKAFYNIPVESSSAQK
jgi:hypothetical protein